MDDLISRQAALDAIKSVRIKHMAQGNDVTPIWECADEVLKVPTVEPTADLSEYCDKLWKTAYERGKAEAQPRKGRWISETKGKVAILDEFGNVSCSAHCFECGDWLTASDEYSCRGNYCPNCGARMEE